MSLISKNYSVVDLMNEEMRDDDGRMTVQNSNDSFCRLRRKVVSLSHCLYQFSSKLKRRLMSSKSNSQSEIKQDDEWLELLDSTLEHLNNNNNNYSDLDESGAIIFSSSNDVPILLSFLFSSTSLVIESMLNFVLTGHSNHFIDHQLPTSSPAIFRWSDLINRVGLNLAGSFCCSSIVLSSFCGCSVVMEFRNFKNFINSNGHLCRRQFDTSELGDERLTIVRFYREIADM